MCAVPQDGIHTGFTFQVGSRSYTLGQERGWDTMSGTLFSVTGDANIMVQFQEKLVTDMTALDGSTEGKKKCEDANAISKLKPQSYMNCVETGAIIVRFGRDATEEILAEDAELRKCFKLNAKCLDKFECEDTDFDALPAHIWKGYLNCGIRGNIYTGCQHDHWTDGTGGFYSYWCSRTSPFKEGKSSSWVYCTWDDACGDKPQNKDEFVTYKYTIWRIGHAVGTSLEKLLWANTFAPAAEFANLKMVLQIFSDTNKHVKALVIDSPKNEHRLLGLDNFLFSEAGVDVLALLICRCFGEACKKFDAQSQPDLSRCVSGAENEEKKRVVSSGFLLFNFMMSMISVRELGSAGSATFRNFNNDFAGHYLEKLLYLVFEANRPGPPSGGAPSEYENVTVEDATAEFLENGLREHFRAEVAACTGFEKALAAMFTWYAKRWMNREQARYGEGSDKWPPAWISDFLKLPCAPSEASSLGLQKGLAIFFGMLFVFGLAGAGWVQFNKRRDPRNLSDGQRKTFEVELVESY